MPTSTTQKALEQIANQGGTVPFGFTAPQAFPVAQVSTKNAIKTVSDAEKRFQEIQGQFEKIKTKADEITKPKEEETEQKGVPVADIVASGDDIAQYDKLDDGTYAPKTEKTQLEIDIEDAQKTLNNNKTQLANATNQLNNFSVANDPQLQGIIGSITSNWDARIRQMEEINKNREANLMKSGLRTGGTRYSTSFGGVMSSEERQGLSRIGELEAQKQAAITDATTAYRNQKWNEYVDLVDVAQQNYENQIKELQKLDKKAKEENNVNSEKLAEIQLSDAVYNSLQLLGENATTESIYYALRQSGIKTTAEEVKNVFKSFVPEKSKDETKNAYEFGNDETGKLISAGFTGEDIQALQDGLNKYGLYTPIPELKNTSLADNLTEKQMSTLKEILFPTPKAEKGINDGVVGDFSDMANGLRVARMAFGSGRALSDADRDFGVELYNKGLSEGLDVYSVVDQTFGFVVVDPEDKALASGLRNALLSIDGQKGMSDYDFEGIARLINSGNDMEAVRKVEDIGIQKILERKSDAILEDDVDYIRGKVKDLTDLLGNGWSNEVGAFTGTFNEWFKRKFGVGGDATIMKAKITNLFAEITNKRAGANVTETEWKRLVAPNIPDLSESGESFVTKLNEAQDDVLEKYNAGRTTVGLPKLNLSHIDTPETRISLYSRQDDNPLNIPVTSDNPLGI